MAGPQVCPDGGGYLSDTSEEPDPSTVDHATTPMPPIEDVAFAVPGGGGRIPQPPAAGQRYW